MRNAGEGEQSTKGGMRLSMMQEGYLQPLLLLRHVFYLLRVLVGFNFVLFSGIKDSSKFLWSWYTQNKLEMKIVEE